MKVTIKNIGKSYGDKVVLQGLNAAFTNEVPTVLMGENGRGKTTLLRLMLGLENPTSGQMLIEGVQGVAAVFQENRLCEEFTAQQNLQMVCPKNTETAILEEHLAGVGLAKQDMQKPVALLSGGQKRRVAIARCLAANADAVFMDEPFVGIDAKTKPLVMQYVSRQLKSKLFVVTTHSTKEAEALGGNVVRIEELQG